MEVSNEIKEDVRIIQLHLINAIRVHQIWVSRLQEDKNNSHFKNKVKDAEKEIIAIGLKQKNVVDRIRRELELYQQRLKARNKQVSVENEIRYVAQQLRDHQKQHQSKNMSISLLKPSVLNEITVKTENRGGNNVSDSGTEIKSSNEKENSNINENNSKEKYTRNHSQITHTVEDHKKKYTNALNEVNESFIGTKNHQREWQETDSDSSGGHDLSPTPSPPLLPEPGDPVTKEAFMRSIGLITHSEKKLIEKKRNERRKRATMSTNKNDFLYGNFEMHPKRRKLNQFPYLQSHSDPPQTRSAKLKKQQNHGKSSREGSPSGSSTEQKVWGQNKQAWMTSLPAGLSVEPIYPPVNKVCHRCGRNDVLSLLVWCVSCSVWQHTGCGSEGRCAGCDSLLPDPAACPPSNQAQIYRDKLVERKRLQERNIELCDELRKLKARAAMLTDNVDERSVEKQRLLAVQIKTQRKVDKLLDFISQFKETSVTIRSTSASDSGSELSKSNEE